MTCVEECDTDSQILIQNLQLQNIQVCRDFEYFVNANSESPVELGTQEHPYKDIESAMVEILNFHSHNPRNVTVNVMEATTVYANSATYIVNMTHVQIQAYNDADTEIGLARMVGIYNSSKIVNPATPTKFNILVHKHELVNQMIFDNPEFDSDDKIGLQVVNAVFKPFHSGLLIKNFRITTDYDDPATAHAIFEPYRIDRRTVGMINCDMRMQGSVMRAMTTAFNWHMENIIQETQYLYRFSLTRLRCGDDRTDMGTQLYFKNFTSINSGGRPTYLQPKESFMRNYVSNNVHFEDCFFDGYVGHISTLSQYIFYTEHNNCEIDDDNKWNFTNIHMTTSKNEEGKNPSFDNAIRLVFVRPKNAESILAIHMTNVTFSNGHTIAVGQILSSRNTLTTYTLKDIKFFNCEGNVLRVMGPRAEIDGLLIENHTLTSLSRFMISIISANETSIKNLEIKNFTDESVFTDPLIQLTQYKTSDITLNNISIQDSMFQNKRALFGLSGSPESILDVDTLTFSNIDLYGDISLIEYTVFKQVTIQNIHCLRTHSLKEGFPSYLINNDYSRDGSAPNNTQIFQNIVVEESTVPILLISKPDSLTNSTQSLQVSNVTYKNSESEFAFELIKVFKMSTIGSYSIIFEDITFRNLTFGKMSKLMYLQQQLQTPVTITNLNVFDIDFAGITVEAFKSNEVYNKTHVSITNMKVNNVDERSRSLFNLYKGAEVKITDSEFSFIGNYDRGAVLSAGKERTIATFRNCSFWNNTSIEGGVFDAESESIVKCYNCIFTNNFAITAGIVKVRADGMFEFYDSIIQNNFALSGAVAELFSSPLTSIFNGSTLIANYGVSKQKIMDSVISQNYIFQSFKDYLNDHSYLLEADSMFTCFKVANAKLSIVQTKLIDQQYVLYSISSRILLSFTNIENMSIESRLFRISESDLTIKNMTLSNLSCVNQAYEIFHLIKAYVEAESIVYSSSTCKLMSSGLSQVSLKELNSSSISLSNVPLITLQHSLDADLNNDGKEIQTSIKDSSFSNISIAGGNLILIKVSEVADISSSSFTQISSQIFKIERSKISNIENVTFSQSRECLLATRSFIDNIHNSRFEGCGNSSITNGGAIRLIDSNSKINQSVFTHNKAKIGASISVKCSFGQTCSNKFTNLVFENNTASIMGGGIYYNLVRPIMNNITNIHNTAGYGPDIASYAVKIVQRGTQNNKVYLNNVGSGLKHEETLYFDLVDEDGQVMALENAYTLKILANDTGMSAKGTVFDRFEHGQAELGNLIFIGKIGLKNITYKLTSASINSKIINEVLNNSEGEYNNIIDASFRYCKPGEIQTSDDQCQECKPTTFTLKENSTECTPCMDFATCEGKDEIKVHAGYWRRSINSSSIIECPNDKACLGGFHPDNEQGPAKCNTGYRGLLCTKCDIVKGIKYQPLSGFQCSKCPKPVLNAIRLIAFVVLAFLFLMLLIYINLRKKKESDVSILLRILTNYIQLIAAFLTFNIKMPTNVTGLFAFTSRVSSPDETFLSFDCFIADYEIRAFAPSNELFKMVLYIFFPIIIAAAIFALFCLIKIIHYSIWAIKHQCVNRNHRFESLFDLKRSMVVSMICIIFLFHPTLAVKSLAMFLCADVDEGDSRMKYHLEYQCYSVDHIKWICLVSIPTLIIWVIGVPCILLRILIQNRSKLGEPKMQRYLLMLYQGLKERKFYWEFINGLRKLAILCINSFMDRFSVNYKVLISVGKSSMLFIVSMLFFYYVQKHVMPYKSYEHNMIDLMSLTTATITIYAGIIFSLENEAYEGFKTFTWLVIVFSNVYFILSWVYLLMLSLGWKNPKFLWLITLVGCIICRRRVDKNEIKQSSITEQIPAVTTLKEATPKRRVFGRKSALKKIRKRKRNRKALYRKKSKREPKISKR
ncbi:unnamed protein product [Moneuplotes crassus]|uniref:Uncharacterized protein n=1 Tax=Euplotes crassus TaxID=5936 RepID=A0AAD1UAE4_EUPCR|nr:unnamed protein product [Moneuplotes crassus]